MVARSSESPPAQEARDIREAGAREPSPASATPESLAARLRSSIGTLVRNTRAADRLASIPATVLALLDTRGPMTTADLAASRGVRHQTMAATVRDLADAGLLSAEPDPHDARKKLLALTASGKEALDADRRQRVAILAEAVATTLDETERQVLAHALDLIDRLGEAIAP